MYDHHIVIAATVAVRPATNAALSTFVAPHAQHSLVYWMGQSLGSTIAVHRLQMTLQVMLAGEWVAAVALGTDKRLWPIRIVRLHVRLQIMLAGRH